tara:strand:- start:5432 stop:7633 length:2202 start_codon:yes stop_codon:yes gene_type:complete
MTKKLKVEYHKNKCIGQGNCAAIASDYFELLGKKATLKNSKNIDKDIYAIEVDCEKDISKNLIEAGKACPVNAIRVVDVEKNEDTVKVEVDEEDSKEIKAEYDDTKEFVIDKTGYFLIRLDGGNKNIEVAFCNEKNKVVLKVTGKKPIDIYQTILNKEGINIRKDHAAYLGRELQKAYIALKYNIAYTQDEELYQIKTKEQQTTDSGTILQHEKPIQENFNVVLITVQPNTDIIGIKYLHAYLRKNGISSRILILPSYDESMNGAIEDFFNKYKPTLVGLSVLSTEFLTIEKLAQFLKSKFDITTFMGGHHATIDPENCLKYADYVLRGEAEETLLEICQKMKNGEDFLNTPNLVYKNGKIIKNPMRMPEQDLDKFPFYENLPPKTYIFHNGNISLMDKYLFSKYTRFSGKYYSLVTTRGCNFKCTFCIHSFTKKMYKEENLNVPLIRTRSVYNCIEELKIMKSKYPDTVYINIQDDNFFGHDIDWIKEFSEKYKKEIGIPICLRAIPIFFTEDKAKLMKECGLTWIFAGLQTGSQRVQKDIYQRYISNEQFLKTADIIHKMNFVPYYDVILDSPFETEEDVLQTIDVILKFKKPYQLQLFSLAFFPGTVVYDIAKERGMEIEDPFTKNYQDFKSNFFNRVIRLIPILPNSFIKYLVKNRNNKAVKMSLPPIYYTSISILEPVSWLKLINMSFSGDIKKTFKMGKSFIKTGIRKIFLHNTSSFKYSKKTETQI